MDNDPQTAGNEKAWRNGLASLRPLARLFVLVLLMVGSVSAALAQSVPVATASSSQQLLPSFPSPVVGRLSTNSFGDLFYVNASYSNTAILYQLVRGTTTPIQIATGFSGARNVYVDSANNLYVAGAYGANIIEFPFVNGAYPTNVNVSSGIPSCNSYTPVVTCSQFGGVGAVAGYYYQPYDMALDAAGNMYVLDGYSNGSCVNNCILKFTKGTSGGTYTPSLVYSNIAPQNISAQIAVDPAGDIFYADSTAGLLRVILAGTTTPVAFGTGITAPAGVSFDPYGNLYVTNAASPYDIIEFPSLKGVVQTATQFAVVNTYSGTAVGVDAQGDMYYTGYSGGTTLNVAKINGIPVGSAAVGTPANGAATGVTFTFATSTMVAGVTSSGGPFTYSPGSCTAGSTYSANNSCTVNVTYTPSAVGLQRGAINLTNATGASVATALLSGIGLGASETNDPGTVSAIGGSFVSPSNIAVDTAGNVFVADPGQNAVLRYAGGTGTPTSIGTGLKAPTAVRLDNAGNVFIGDGGNNRIVEVPNYNGTLTNAGQTVLTTGLGTNLSLAFDFLGNLYIADRANPSVVELMSVGGIPRTTSSLTVATGFTSPSALATDANGNLFIADLSAGALTEVTFLGKASSTVGGGLTQPTGLAVDASGSLYIADAGNRVVKLPLEGTAFNTNDQYVVNATVLAPFGVALDGAANLYIVDKTNATANVVNRTAGTAALGRAQINTTTSAQNINVGNAGNQTLRFGTPQYVATSTTPTYFAVTPATTAGCSIGGSALLTGRSCALSATFSPTTTGTFSEVLTFTSNAANATTQTETLTGKGLNLAADTLVLTQTSAAANFGSPVTVQAVVSSTVAGTPTGTVTFSVDGNPQSPPPNVTNGMATITLTGLTGGSHQICGAYTGDDNYRPSNSCVTVTVAKASTNTSIGITGASVTPVTSAQGSTSTLTAIVVASASTQPTGTVTFSVGTTVLGTAPLAAATGGGYKAVLTTTLLPAGNITVTATYNGDINYNVSSGSANDIVTYPTFVVTPTTNAITVKAGQTGGVNLTVTALGGFAGTIGIQCLGLPANTICSFSPNQFPLATDSPQIVTMQIITGRAPVSGQPIVGALRTGGKMPLLAFLGLTLLFAGRSRKAWRGVRGRALTGLTLLLLFPLALAISGCGGSGFVGVTPTGTYNVTISAGGTNSTTPYTAAGNAAGCTLNATASSCIETAAVTLVVQ